MNILELRLAYKKAVKNQIVNAMFEVKNPLKGTPMEGVYYFKILGEVVEKFKAYLPEENRALQLFGDKYEIEKMLTQIHTDIQEEAFDM